MRWKGGSAKLEAETVERAMTQGARAAAGCERGGHQAATLASPVRVRSRGRYSRNVLVSGVYRSATWFAD